MPADTYAYTPVALPGYPTDLTPAGADGLLRSWLDGLGWATVYLYGARTGQPTDAQIWRGLADAAHRYVVERGETDAPVALVVAAATQMIETARDAHRSKES